MSDASANMSGSLLTNVFVLLVLLVHAREIHVEGTSASDSAAIRDLRRALNIKLDWFVGDPCESFWQGVSCDDTRSAIIGLNLNNMQLSGSLPPSIGTLTSLQFLDLSFNKNLTGPIPATIGNLVNLIRLNLQSCGFTGPIPVEIGQLRSLSFLALNGNSLSQRIPSSIGLLKSLDWCDLSYNELSGELPVSASNDVGFDNMTLLRHMHLNNNNLSGSIPTSITTLPRLVHLLLDHNNFSGTIPPEIGNFQLLRILRLDNNGLSGPVPSSVTQLTKLTELHLTSNQFNGSLPDLSGIPTLQLIRAGYDSAATPSGLPAWILSMDNLKTIELSQRNLIGSIPSTLFALPNIEAIYMDSNFFNGSVDFGSASQSLEFVSLEQNNITNVGNLPSSLTASLENNPVCKTNGSQPYCKADEVEWTPRPNLCRNTCSDSKLLNPEGCTCAYALLCTIQFITPAFGSITQNRIENVTGRLSEAFNMSAGQIWIGSAAFTSEHRLVMNILFFPPGKEVYLKPSLVSDIILKLSIQGVSFPDFGPLLLTSSNYPQTAPLSSVERTKYNFIITIISCVGASAVIASLCIVFWVRRNSKRATTSGTEHPNSYGLSSIVSEIAPNFKGCRLFTIDELNKASDGFARNNLIGVGGYGKVFKGKLPTGELVAIKRADKESLQGVAEFRTEIELFSRLHHKNLVNLIGFCTADGEQMLVYEFMPNRTLRDHLLERSEALDWSTRLAIALGAAKGLEYLHELADPPVIHRDVKSSNILLDENLVAKVADLGLSKLAPTSKDGKLYTITQVKGTLGYLDPEYYAYQHLSDKSDVYSFGVVLIEIITGRQPIDRGSFIVKEIKDFQGQGGGLSSLSVFVESNLVGAASARAIRRYFKLVLECVEDSSQDRPRMSEVVKKLEAIIKLEVQQKEKQHQEKQQTLQLQQQEEHDDESVSQSLRLSFQNERKASFGLSEPEYSQFEMWSGQGPPHRDEDDDDDDEADHSFQAFRFSGRD